MKLDEYTTSDELKKNCDDNSKEPPASPPLAPHDEPRTPQLSPASSTTTESTSPTLNTMLEEEAQDVIGISLLRQIFPDESIESLRKIHHENIRSKKRRDTTTTTTDVSFPKSQLGRRIWKEALLSNNDDEQQQQQEPLHWQEPDLPGDFLRLPAAVAVRRYDEPSERWEYKLVNEMEKRVLQQYRQQARVDDGMFFSAVIYREGKLGLGMTLIEDHGKIRVYSLTSRQDGKQWLAPVGNNKDVTGPALDAGMYPQDIVLGINGTSLRESVAPTESLIRHAVSKINNSPDPVVLHVLRPKKSRDSQSPMEKGSAASSTTTPPQSTTTSLLDTTVDYFDESMVMATPPPLIAPQVQQPKDPEALIHPFAKSLASRRLIHDMNDKLAVTIALAQYTERAHQWESTHAFRIDGRTHRLLPDPPASIPLAKNNSTPSTPTLPTIPRDYVDMFLLENSPPTKQQSPSSSPSSNKLISPRSSKLISPRSSKLIGFPFGTYPGLRNNISEASPSPKTAPRGDIFIPLLGVRKALSARILNTFADGDRIAYTVWVHDAESGREWYAPIRYFSDFQDLKAATQHLCPWIANVPFPTRGWSVFGMKETSESSSVRESKCRQLEHFLRVLCVAIYREELHPDVAEIAIHVQSFLGCEVQQDDKGAKLQAHNAHAQSFEAGHDVDEMNVRLLLKRSIQRYTYRLLLLDVVSILVGQFVDNARTNGPTLQDVEVLEARSRSALKSRAIGELEHIQGFLDKLQAMILEGCMDDFESIAERPDFSAIHKFMKGPKGSDYWERLVREAVREQIEIEVYVPLRSNVSRLLVNGWRHEDMEVHFKMQELRKRPQGQFRIPVAVEGMSDWNSVSLILREGVGFSTLPCAKLRAVVDAAREITNLYTKAQGNSSSEANEDEDLLGADDFLPIFIFCVVRAEMERPCALCILLRTLCDQINRLGETGYYLASFEAAITHIQELDLTEDREEMLSFLSVPLSETSAELKG